MGLGWLFELSVQWKPISTPRPTADIMNDESFRHLQHTNLLTKSPTLLGAGRLEIQLSPISGKESRLLSEAVFQPRQFTVVLEQGNFAAVRDVRYGQRMTFDASPYPTLVGYDHRRRGGPSPEELYELLSGSRSFYAGDLSDELVKARATEDDTITGYHTSSCALS